MADPHSAAFLVAAGMMAADLKDDPVPALRDAARGLHDAAVREAPESEVRAAALQLVGALAQRGFGADRKRRA